MGTERRVRRLRVQREARELGSDRPLIPVNHKVTRHDLVYRARVLGSLLEKASYLVRPRAARALTLPNFLCIGAQRAGTTWLRKNLRGNPEIFMQGVKEIH